MIKGYKKYKDSGITWIGRIPEHWNIDRLASFGYLKKGTGISKKDLKDTGLPAILYGDLYTKYDISTKKVINKIDEKTSLNSVSIEKNTILFTGSGETLEDIGKSIVYLGNQVVFVGGDVIIYKPKQLNSLFLSYWLSSQKATIQKIQIAKGNIIFHIYASRLKNILFSYPNIQEQTQIANYLDAKTQAIDKKVSVLEQKIAIYRELRKNLINETVTRGLDKNVTLKDSGIDWIRKIPEHWEVKRIKDIFSISRGRVIAKTELKNNGKYPVYSSQTQNNGVLGYINTFDFNSNLLTWTTDGVNAGTVFLRKGKFNCTNICGTLSPKSSPNLNLKYMAYAVQQSTKHNKRIDTNGAKIMNNEMAFIDIIFPPLKEQTQIATYLDKKTQKIGAIIINIQK